MSEATFTLDSGTIQKLVERAAQDKILSTVNSLINDPQWLARVERSINQTIVQTASEHIRSVDVNAIVNTKVDANNLDDHSIQRLIEQVAHTKILSVVETIINDGDWAYRIERLISQAVTQETISRIGSIDINTIIHKRVDENNIKNKRVFLGINDQSTEVQLTVMDDYTVVENTLTARELNIVDGATVNHLAVKGSINTDNPAWDELAKNISAKTLTAINDSWRDQLVKAVTEQIQSNGINFDDIKISNQSVFNGSNLTSAVTGSKLQSVGVLRELIVDGEAKFNNSLSVLNKRVGINTDSPELALTVWDEEVAVNIGKLKANQAYIGTSRAQGLSLGVNRTTQIDIAADGITTVNRLRVGQHMISHSVDVPGWTGTRGDIVFNASPKDDGVFAWVCLGGYQWQTLKSAQ
jgi:hypothetical protein